MRVHVTNRLTGPLAGRGVGLDFAMRYAPALLVALLVGVSACGTDEQPQTPPAVEPAAATDVESRSGLDTTGAAVWAHLVDADYQSNWQLWPELGEYYTGREPHGMLLTTYLNDVAYTALQGDATEMPDGAVIVKENYMPDSTLAAVTVMVKAAGYNTEHNDWFFSKHLPSGDLDRTPEGMPMEGRLLGCQACHSGQRANDYLFSSALSPE